MAEYQALRDRVIRRGEERDRIKARNEVEHDYMLAISQAKDTQITGFWCKYCGKDFEGVGDKRIGGAGMWPTAWYVARCLCGRHAMRRITDKSKDQYYYWSKMIRTQRAQMGNDLLTPDDPLFEVIYAKQYREMEKKRHEYTSTENSQ